MSQYVWSSVVKHKLNPFFFSLFLSERCDKKRGQGIIFKTYLLVNESQFYELPWKQKTVSLNIKNLVIFTNLFKSSKLNKKSDKTKFFLNYLSLPHCGKHH